MKDFWQLIWRMAGAVAALLLAPAMTLIAAFAVAVADLAATLSGKGCMRQSGIPSTAAASIVIPNWNGRDLLAKYLPSVMDATAGNPANEIIVVDNGSTDGSVEFVRENFPGVRILALGENLGFGGGSNAGISAARNDIAVLLNSDMRVETGFLAPLLEGFTDEKVFAVSCQIFFSDPSKRREETGLAQGWWEHGGLRVGHREDPDIVTLFPCFYGGGGSCAFHREKFLELGGFDEIFRPFYLEDTDLGYMAWKRGWKVLYQPRSVVYHEHRGTIGKRFSDAYIQGVLKKNFLLFTWKNIHEWRKLGPHFLSTVGGVIFSAVFGDSAERPNLLGLWKALRQLPGALSARRRARSLSVVSDTEAFRRPLGGYFRDRFEAPETEPGTLRVLFFSPYPIYPPTHGGAVFMYQTVRALANLCELHLFILLEYESEYEPHRDLDRIAASSLCVLRPENKRKDIASLRPNSVREFRHRETEWLLHRQLYLNRVDVLQLEYTTLGQYAPAFERMACVLFEHDVYFQSIARALPYVRGGMKRVKAQYEYLRALRFELSMLRKVDRIQVCSGANAGYLLQFAPELQGKIDDDLRAGIDTAGYSFQPDGREPDTMLFLGSFRHVPNQEGLQWFTREVLPRILEKRPRARLVVVGSEPPARHSLPFNEAIELRGFVEDVREPLNRYAVFVCPILSGSGMRVKLLEAFAAGIPVVSTSLGAEGLAGRDGELCALADRPEVFAGKVVELLTFREKAAELAVRARGEVETNKNMTVMTARLAESYREALRAKRKR